MNDSKNTFVKGWTQDVEPSLQSPNTVRDLENMRLISDVNNTYSLESIKGTKKIFTLNPNYFPIGWTTIGNDVIILSTKDITGTDQNGEIGVATIDPISGVGTYVPYYNTQALTFNSAHQIECWVYFENKFIERIYWTDNYNPLRALNLKDSIFTTYYNQAAVQAAVGTVFMVLTDSVTNGTSTYGPNEASGTVFTADGTETFTGTPLVIAYYDVQNIDVVPARDQGNITFNSWLPNGNVEMAAYQFAYQLYTLDGIESNFSYLTMPFHMGNSTVPNLGSLAYQAYQGGALTNDSQKGMRIQIDNIDQSFSNIRVVAVKDTGLISTDPPIVFYDGSVTASTMTFDFMGNENIAILAITDLEKVVLAIEKVKTGAILKKRFFIGNVTLSEFAKIDTSSATAVTIEYLCPTDTQGRPSQATGDSSVIGLNGCPAAPSTAGVASGFILSYAWYQVNGTGSITYNAVVYNVGDVFQGVATVHAFVVTSGAPIVNAVIRIQKYTGQYRYIQINDDWYDTKAAATATHLRSYWRGERYRYAIVFYDRFQNPMYAQWLMDKSFPHQYSTTDPDTGAPLGYNPRLMEEIPNDYGAGLHGGILRNLGIKFSHIDFNSVCTNLNCTIADLPKFIGGFSIVVADRDKQVLSQGLLMPTVIDANNTRPTATSDITGDSFFAANGRRPNTYNFYSPEFNFLFNGLPNLQQGDQLSVQDYYEDSYSPNLFGATNATLETNNYHYYEKFYDQVAAPGGFPAKGTSTDIFLAYSTAISVNEQGVAYGAPGLQFNNSTTALGADFGTGNRDACGADTYLMFVTYDEATHTAGFAGTGGKLSLVNFVRPKGNLYGGTSDSAKADTLYRFCGHYQPMDAAFVSYLQGNAGIADDIEVFGGDTFVCVYDIGRMIKEDNSAGGTAFSFGAFFPVESSINISLRQGRHLSRDRSYEFGSGINLNGLSFSNPTQVEEFVYNNAYSYQESQIQFPALPANFVATNEYTRRVYVSPVKIDGQTVDSFRIFPVNDYIDLDGQNEDLINLRSKAGKLYYWQKRAVGNLPVLERDLVPSTLGQPISIGVGGVLERFDDIQNYYGNQHQWGLGETEGAFMWFDINKKTLCQMAVDGSTADVSTSSLLRTYFADLNGNFITGDNPVRNMGVCAQFNPKFKEMVFAFRGIGFHDPLDNYVPNGVDIAWDNIDQQFEGKYTIQPGMMLQFNNMLLMSLCAKYRTIAALTHYSVGDQVTEGTDNYICVLDFTTTAIPTNPSSDSTHWKKTSSINEVHVADLGSVCTFFGVVYPNYLQFVLHGSDDMTDIVFDNLRAHCSPEFFDTAEYENSIQTQSESNISVDTQNYQYLNRSWFWSIPYASDQDRFRDHYLMVKLIKDNRLAGSHTISRNERVKIVSVSAEMRETM